MTAADRLLEEKAALAAEVTAALYGEMPELLTRHGEYGRAKCLQDMHYTIEHLAPAVDLQEPEIFARYARWLNELLTAPTSRPSRWCDAWSCWMRGCAPASATRRRRRSPHASAPG